MIVYRLAPAKYASSLDGTGAKMFGGRWNHIGVPCVYTSATRALAVLEYSVNVELHSIPRALRMLTIEIPDHILTPPLPALPGDWRTYPSPTSTRDFGTGLLKAKTYPVICLPSIVIAEELNYLLDPLHPGATSFRILDMKDFVYDIRIKMG